GINPEVNQTFSGPNRNKVNVGDRVFIRKTGGGTRGIIASGWVTGTPVALLHWDGSSRGMTYVPLKWDGVVDFDNPLDLNEIAELYPSAVWKGMQGGLEIPKDAVNEVEHQWSEKFSSSVEILRDVIANAELEDSPIERLYAETLVRSRRHQRKFRALLLRYKPAECEVDGCNVSEPRLLEAAHIVPDSLGGEASLDNGLILCRNHHRALDVNILEYIDGEFHWAVESERF
ncbi:HNH endonuclease, partial [Brevibacterium sanguinis]|uniref:HNH endonuclease n=1 Tax=Brevibacterium sanguinis TaxID=232444 RepID=UPI0031D9488B